MCALCVDAEHESLAGRGLGARVEACDERAAELHLALARQLRFDAVGAEVEECLRAELLCELDRDGNRVAGRLGWDETWVEEVLGSEAEQHLAFGSVEAGQHSVGQLEPVVRERDPDLDLWTTAKPFLERWMSEQIGWRGLLRNLRQEAPYWANTLPQLPRLAYRALADDRLGALRDAVERLTAQNKRRNDLLTAILAVLAAAVVIVATRMI